jgi:hypothetical protein
MSEIASRVADFGGLWLSAPQWSPPRAQDVTQAMVEAIFAPLPEDEEWKSL